ncbi:hypothetical protein ASZ78_010423, partial [Callipepla squamata]
TTGPPCSCLNGGFCQDSACVCPSEWAGPFCDIECVFLYSFCTVNFCEDSVYTVNVSENVMKNLTFERTIVGQYSSSKEKCEPNTVNGNSPIAVRMCSRKGIIPVLEPPSILNCNENLDSLVLQVETADASNVSTIASNTQILTSIPSRLTTQNISVAANIAVKILRKPNISEHSQAPVAVLTTVSQLLDANETEFNNNNLVNVTASLTKTMEEFSLMGNVTQPNVAVQSVPLKLNSTILFLAQKGKLGHVVGFTGTRSEGSSNDGRVGFVLYQNDKLFQSRVYKSKINLSKQIVSGNVDGGRASGVEIAFNPKAFQIKYKYAKPLEYVSYVGVGLSIAGLITTILFQIFTR